MTVEEIAIARTTAADALATTVAAAISGGARFAGLYATSTATDRVRLTALLADGNGLTALDTVVEGPTYPSLSPAVPAAFWYERAIHDLHGIIPDGHPRLDPLILPLPHGATRPRPGSPDQPGSLDPDHHVVTRRVLGIGLFTIPHGPVRSGVMEAVEYLVETPGEDIPFLRLRPHYKHRGVEKRFEGMTAADGVLVAERVEGVATVAHATAYAQAVESLAGVVVPEAALLVRLLHAELERVANHLDVIVRLAEAAGLAVAIARFGWHKECVLRLVGAACGSRFGRGVVIPGGVTGLPRAPRAELRREVQRLRTVIGADARLLLRTSSFLDRLRRTGTLPSADACAHGAIGPVGRASGCLDDVRLGIGYGAYPALRVRATDVAPTGDALARLRVRVAEIDESLRLADAAADRLAIGGNLAAPFDERGIADGRALGRVEAPQGEVVYAIDVADGRITRCWPRSASFHNMAAFGSVFTGDVLTDFPFIEASFGTSIAGVAL